MWNRVFGRVFMKSPSQVISDQYYEELLGEEGYRKKKREDLIEQIAIRIISMALALFITYLIYRG